MQKPTAQNLPQAIYSLQNNDSRKREVELTQFQQLSSTPKIFSEAEIETEELPLSIDEAGDTRILMPPNSQEVFGLLESPNHDRIIEAEQACFLRKTCIILASMIIWIVLTIDETSSNKKLETLGLIAFCCVIYNLVENVIIYMRQNLVINGMKQRLFDIIDGALILYFLLAIKFWERESPSKYLLILWLGICLISLVIYFRLAISNNAKAPLIRGVCYALQLSIFAMKIQGYNSLDWTTVFLPFGLNLASHQIYGSYFLVKASVRLYRQVGIEDLSFVRNCVRMSWNVIHYGLIFIVFGVFVDLLNQAAEKKINELIRLLLAIMQLYSGLLLTFAVIFFKFIREYDSELCENSDEENSISRIKPDLSRENYSLVPQDGLLICSFSKISLTYFVRVDEKSSQEEEKITLRFDEIDEACCYICEENQPNIITMGCGHGGMCKECVLLSMEKNNSCMQCRKPAQSIYQIKSEDKNSGMVEACQVFSIDY